MKAKRLPEPALRTASWDAEPGDRTGAELATTDRVLMKPRRYPAQWLAEALPNAHVQQRPQAEAGKTQVSATSRPPHVAVRSSLANVTPGSQASPAREHKRGRISVTRVPPAWKAAVLCPFCWASEQGRLSITAASRVLDHPSGPRQPPSRGQGCRFLSLHLL